MIRLFNRFKRPCVVRRHGNIKVRGSLVDLLVMTAACLMAMEKRGVNVQAVKAALAGLDMPPEYYVAKAAEEARRP